MRRQLDDEPIDGEPIRVVIVDDHPLVSDGLQALLRGQPGIEVVGVCNTGVAAIQIVREQLPTVLLLDLRLPDISGIAVATQVHKEHPQIAILILTGYQDDEFLRSLATEVAQGYLLKKATGDEVVAAIREVGRGGSVLESQAKNPAQEYSLYNLTERETAVLRLLKTGHRNREIADALHVTIKTVEFHVSRIFEKLGVHSRTEAISKVILEGLILPEEDL